MKVCIISQDFIPVWSGIGTYLSSLLRHVPKDFEIHLITARRRICGKTIETGNEDNILKEIGQNVSIHYVSEISNNFLDHFKFQVACGGFVPDLCKNEKIDIVHSNFPLMPDIAVKLFRKLKIPSIATVHSTIEGQHESVKKAHVGFECLQTSDMANLMLSYPLGVLERLYTRRTSHFIAVSNFAKNEIIRYFNVPAEKIRVIYHGVDTSAEGLKLVNNSKVQPFSSEKPVVLYTGRLAAGKGISCLVKAIPMVLKQFPNVCFHIIGGGQIGSYLPKFLENELRGRNSLVHGYVNHSAIGSYYRGCSVYVSPTLYDALGLGILEAMSLGKPVIASAVGGVPEIIEHQHNGLLVSPNDPIALADAIVRLLNDPDLSELLGKNARNTVMAKFSMERMRNETYEYYRSVLKNA